MEKRRKRNYLYSVYFLVQIIVLLLCYSIYLNKIIKPSEFPYFGIMALVFPMMFILYVFMSILGLFSITRRSIMMLFLAIPLGFSFANIYRFPNSNKKAKGLKILTYNVKYGESGMKSLENYVNTVDADISFLQEIYKRQWRKEAFLPNNYNSVYDFVGISSKYPIVFDRQINFLDSNAHACMADIVIKEDTIRVFNVYLESIYLSQVFQKIKTTDDVENNSELVKNKLVQGYKAHQWQLEFLMGYIKESPYPVIVAGDFNSVPNSYEYYRVTKKLTDAFTENGSGLGTSFHNYKFPIRIDYVFHDDSFTSSQYQVDHKTQLSDHFPVISYLQKK